jgi:peptide-methionine (S)-S-oxide reductase
MTRISKYAAAFLLAVSAIVGCNSADETTSVPPLSEVGADGVAGEGSPSSVASTSSADGQTQIADATGTQSNGEEVVPISVPVADDPLKPQMATFGSGCFWCVEAVFELLDGVEAVESGYCNGDVENPTYEQVCTGLTGHAEVIRLTYDPSVIKFEELLEVFWNSHDPTTLNRQGYDEGTQYRSGVYYHTEKQKQLALAYKKKLNDEQVFDNPVVTEVVKADTFYPAEKKHQDFFALNPTQSYCRAVINPKVDKVRRVFAEKLKPGLKK